MDAKEIKKTATVILAAGEGTRMNSAIPKVLHVLAGKPMIEHVLYSVMKLGCGINCVIVGFKKEQVMERLKKDGCDGKIKFVYQDPPLGSGHAVLQAEAVFKDFYGDILVTCGDMPLLKTDTFKGLINTHRSEKNAATILTACVNDPFGYGRIITDVSGRICGIVEEKDASPAQKKLNVVNTGIYCFRGPELFASLKEVRPDNKKKEYYITDVVKIMYDKGKKTGMVGLDDIMEAAGINTPQQLAGVERYLEKAENDNRRRKKENAIR